MNTDFGLIDSNLARAAEGLRVLDEMARFIFVDSELCIKLKNLRHELQAISNNFGPQQLLVAREGEDSGKAVSTAFENTRTNSWSLIRANSCRVIESLRALEEFSKIYTPSATTDIKKKRYEMYQLETKLLQKTPQYYVRKYFEEGTVYPLSDSVEEILWLVDHGANIIQLRDKNSDRSIIRQKARCLAREIAERNSSRADKILLILNDSAALAAELPVDGVHLGQEDGSIIEARRLLGSNKIIGRSDHSITQLRQAVVDGADYVSIGPIFATPTKPDRAAVGLEVVKQVAAETTVPWLAIGGIDAQTIGAVKKAGAKNVAVVRSAREFFGR